MGSIQSPEQAQPGKLQNPVPGVSSQQEALQSDTKIPEAKPQAAPEEQMGPPEPDRSPASDSKPDSSSGGMSADEQALLAQAPQMSDEEKKLLDEAPALPPKPPGRLAAAALASNGRNLAEKSQIYQHLWGPNNVAINKDGSLMAREPGTKDFLAVDPDLTQIASDFFHGKFKQSGGEALQYGASSVAGLENAGGMATGAIAGAAMGSVVPGAGTAVGAAIGGLASIAGAGIGSMVAGMDRMNKIEGLLGNKLPEDEVSAQHHADLMNGMMAETGGKLAMYGMVKAGTTISKAIQMASSPEKRLEAMMAIKSTLSDLAKNYGSKLDSSEFSSVLGAKEKELGAGVNVADQMAQQKLKDPSGKDIKISIQPVLEKMRGQLEEWGYDFGNNVPKQKSVIKLDSFGNPSSIQDIELSYSKDPTKGLSPFNRISSEGQAAESFLLNKYKELFNAEVSNGGLPMKEIVSLDRAFSNEAGYNSVKTDAFTGFMKQLDQSVMGIRKGVYDQVLGPESGWQEAYQNYQNNIQPIQELRSHFKSGGASDVLLDSALHKTDPTMIQNIKKVFGEKGEEFQNMKASFVSRLIEKASDNSRNIFDTQAFSKEFNSYSGSVLSELFSKGEQNQLKALAIESSKVKTSDFLLEKGMDMALAPQKFASINKLAKNVYQLFAQRGDAWERAISNVGERAKAAMAQKDTVLARKLSEVANTLRDYQTLSEHLDNGGMIPKPALSQYFKGLNKKSVGKFAGTQAVAGAARSFLDEKAGDQGSLQNLPVVDENGQESMQNQ